MNLKRSNSDKMIFGVAGGLARTTGVDVIIFRIAFAVLTVMGLSGIPIYLVLWILMPREEGGSVAQDLIASITGKNNNTGS